MVKLKFFPYVHHNDYGIAHLVFYDTTLCNSEL